MILNKKDWMFTNMIEFSNYLERLADGKYVLKKYTRNRTVDQNSYLHWLFGEIAKDTGTDLDYVKFWMKKKFLTVHIYKEPHTKDTSSLNTVEFNEFIENVLNYIATLWITYPTPEEYKKWLYN